MSYECFEECNSRIIIYDNIKFVEGIPIDYQELKIYEDCIKSGNCYLRLPSKSSNILYIFILIFIFLLIYYIINSYYFFYKNI